MDEIARYPMGGAGLGRCAIGKIVWGPMISNIQQCMIFFFFFLTLKIIYILFIINTNLIYLSHKSFVQHVDYKLPIAGDPDCWEVSI